MAFITSLIALQVTGDFGLATPGEDVIVSQARSSGVAKERMDGADNLDCKDWFFCTYKLNKDTFII